MKNYIFCNKVLFLHKDILTFLVQVFHILENVRESNDSVLSCSLQNDIQTLNSSRPLTAMCTDTRKMYDLRR